MDVLELGGGGGVDAVLELFAGGLDGADLFGDFAELDFAVVFSDVVAEGFEAAEGDAGLHEWGEDGLHAEVVALGDGVEFMVVAAGAAGGEAEDYGGRRVDEVGEDFDAVDVGLVGEAVAVGADAEEAGAGDGGGFFAVEFVAGDLLAEEAGVGFVGVEGVDDVVAIAPGVGDVGIEFEAGGVGVADEVEPVAAPFFAVAGGGEELVDELFVGRGFGELAGAGGEAGEVVIGAADEGGAVGLGGGGELMFGVFGGDEMIYSITGPGGRGGGDGGAFDGLEGPPFGDRGSGGVEPGGTGVDPVFEGSDIGGVEGFAGGHGGDAGPSGDGFVDATGGGLGGAEGGAAGAALEGGGAGGEIETGHFGGGAVAAEAVFGEDGVGAVGKILRGEQISA